MLIYLISVCPLNISHWLQLQILWGCPKVNSPFLVVFFKIHFENMTWIGWGSWKTFCLQKSEKVHKPRVKMKGERETGNKQFSVAAPTYDYFSFSSFSLVFTPKAIQISMTMSLIRWSIDHIMTYSRHTAWHGLDLSWRRRFQNIPFTPMLKLSCQVHPM